MLNKHNFQIAELAPQDEERLILCGIRVTPEGTSVCDGHMAMTVSSFENVQPSLFEEMEGVIPAEHFSPFVLDRESALRIAKAIPKKASDADAVYPIVDATTENNDRAMVSINDIFRQEIIRARKIEGNFPDVSKVIPDRDRARFRMRLSPDLLLACLKVAQRFCAANETLSVELSIFDTGDPLRIDAVALGQTLTAVIMPMKSGDAPEA